MCDHNRNRYNPEEQAIMDEYSWRCVICGFACADELHEEPPRSLNPNWMYEPWKRFPLCKAHHRAIQDMPREDAEEMLLYHTDIYFPGVLKRIKEDVEL